MYRSCSRTEADEEFLLIRLQVFCLLMGSFAFLMVRRQKVSSANLFDQRKNYGGRGHGITKPLASVNIEMATKAEKQPLTETDSMEVV